MRKISHVTRRHEQVHLTYQVSDENGLNHENISLIMARSADTEEIFAGFRNGAKFHLEVRYLNPLTDETLTELTHNFTKETFQGLIDAVNGDTESYTILCQRECLDTDEVTEVEFILPLKDNRRLEIFVQRFIALSHVMQHDAIDHEYPYDFETNQPIAEA